MPSTTLGCGERKMNKRQSSYFQGTYIVAGELAGGNLDP